MTENEDRAGLDAMVGADHPRPCRACGMPIVFVVGPSGRIIPAQRVRTVYKLGATNRLERALAEGPELAHFVSHFETCPNAGRFSKRPRR